jgi:hypothetical protein
MMIFAWNTCKIPVENNHKTTSIVFWGNESEGPGQAEGRKGSNRASFVIAPGIQFSLMSIY